MRRGVRLFLLKSFISKVLTSPPSCIKLFIPIPSQCSATLDGNPFIQVDASGVKVYILDTGVRSTHTEFAGMIGTGCSASFIDGETNPLDDGNGHG